MSTQLNLAASCSAHLMNIRRSLRYALAILTSAVVANINVSAQSAAAPASVGPSSPTAIPSIVVKYLDQFYVPDYSQYVLVYENAADPALASSPTSRPTYCFVPHPVLDVERLTNDFHALEESLTPLQRTSPVKYSLELNISYEMQRVKQVIATSLSARYSKTINPDDVITVPLNAFEVYALFHGTQVTVYHIPEDAAGLANNMIPAGLPEPITCQLSVTYDE